MSILSSPSRDHISWERKRIHLDCGVELQHARHVYGSFSDTPTCLAVSKAYQEWRWSMVRRAGPLKRSTSYVMRESRARCYHAGGVFRAVFRRTGDPAGRDASITLVGRIASIRIAIAGQKDDLGRTVSVLPLCIVLCPTNIVSIFAYHVEMWNSI